MAAIYGVNGPTFGDGQQQKKTQTTGIILPTGGLLVGGATGYALKSQPSQDEYKASLKDGKDIKYTTALTDSENALVKAAKEEVTKASDSTESKKAETDTKTTEAKPAETKTPEVTTKPGETAVPDNIKTDVEYHFGTEGTKKTVSPAELLGGRTVEAYQKEVIDTSNEKLKKADKTLEDFKTEQQANTDATTRARENYKTELALAEEEKIKDTEAVKAARTEAKGKLDKAKDELKKAQDHEENLKKLLGENDPEYIKAQTETKTKQAEVEALEDAALTPREKAVNKAKAEADAKLKEVDEAKKASDKARADADAVKDKPEFEAKDKEAKRLEAETKQKQVLADEAKAIEQERGAQNPLTAAKTRVENALKAEETTKGVIDEAIKDKSNAAADLAKKQTYLDLAKEAGPNKAISKESFISKLTGNVTKAETEVLEKAGIDTPKVETALEKAYKAVGSKLESFHSWKKAGIFAGIGLAVGIVAKLIVDSSKPKEPQA